MTWWQQLILNMIPAILVLISVLLGGWLVFRTKTITMPTPFLQDFKKKKGEKPHSYVADLYQEKQEDYFDEELSPAAARLRDQKLVEENRKGIKVVGGE